MQSVYSHVSATLLALERGFGISTTNLAKVETKNLVLAGGDFQVEPRLLDILKADVHVTHPYHQ